MKDNPNSKKWRKKADTAWGLVIRQIGYCEMCGKGTGLNAHHIIFKVHVDYRHDPSNGMCLCSRCHRWGDCSPHLYPTRFMQWMKDKQPGQWKWFKAHTVAKERELYGSPQIVRGHIANDWGLGMSYKDKFEMLTEMYENLKET